ncbi:Shprh [Symbiodinium sp. CCMP2456]|nr:Shprh [Symbiodinium sp. CCMP2456]
MTETLRQLCQELGMRRRPPMEKAAKASEMASFLSLTNGLLTEPSTPQIVLHMPPSRTRVSRDGRWLGIVIYAPFYQPQTWALSLDMHPCPDALLEALLQLGDDLFDEGLDTVVPLRPQRFNDYASMLMFPKVLGDLHPDKHVAAVVDASTVGGHHFPAVLPRSVSVSSLLHYLRQQLRADVDSFWVYVGLDQSPYDETAVLCIEDGDVLTIARRGEGPPRAYVFTDLFRDGVQLGRPHQTPGAPSAPRNLCLLHGRERYCIHASFHDNRTPLEAAALFVDADPAEVTVCEAEGFGDLDMMGDSCPKCLAVVKLPPRDGTDHLSTGRVDTFTFLDLRPLGLRPQCHYSHAHSVHLPTLLALYDVRLPLGTGLQVLGGLIQGDYIEVPSVATLVLRALPLQPRVDPHGSYAAALFDRRMGPDTAPDSDTETEGPDHNSHGPRQANAPSTDRRSRSPARQPPSAEGPRATGCPDNLQVSQVQVQVQAKGHHLPARILDIVQGIEVEAGFLTGLMAEPLQCKLRETPDLTVRQGEEIQLTHEAHLQVIYQPFGEGVLPADAPPELTPGDEDQDMGEDTRRQHIHAMFLLLTPQYAVDVVLVHLHVGCSVPEALEELDDVRVAERRAWFSHVVPAQPQVTREFAVLLASPSWDLERVYVLIDARAIQGTLFAERLPDQVAKGILLEVAGLGVNTDVEVYLHDELVPLHDDQLVRLWHGVTFLPAGQPFEPGTSLAVMLQTPQGWDANAPIPCQNSPAFTVLTDEGRARYPIDFDRRAQLRTDIATYLGYEARRLTLRRSLPIIEDYSDRGWHSRAVVVATQSIRRPVPRPPQQFIVIYDLRPLLEGLRWVVLQQDFIPIAALFAELRPLCPEGHALGVAGGRPDQHNGESVLRVADGQTIIFEVAGLPRPTVSAGDESDDDSDSGRSEDTYDAIHGPGDREARSRTSGRRAPFSNSAHFRLVDGRFFCDVVPEQVTRGSLLDAFFSQSEGQEDVQVFVGAGHCLTPGQDPIALYTGVRIRFQRAATQQAADAPHLPEQTPAAPAVPLFHVGTSLLVLGDGASWVVPCEDRAVDPNALVDALGLAHDRVTCRLFRTPLQDLCWQGQDCQHICVCIDNFLHGPRLGEEHGIALLDCRAILRGLSWDFLSHGFCAVDRCRERYAYCTPPGCLLEVLGDPRHHLGQRTWIAHPEALFQLVFTQAIGDDAGSDVSVPAAEGSIDRTGSDLHTSTASGVTQDVGAWGVPRIQRSLTSPSLRSTQARTGAATGSGSGAPPALRWLARATLLCTLLCPGASVQLGSDQAGAWAVSGLPARTEDVSASQVASPDVHLTEAHRFSSHVPTAVQVGPRTAACPIPGRTCFPPAQGPARPIEARRPLPTPCRAGGFGVEWLCSGPTLLEQCARSPSFQGFFLAWTLLEVLEEEQHYIPVRDADTRHVISLDSSVPLTSFQISVQELQHIVPALPSGGAVDYDSLHQDWLDADLRPLLADPLVPPQWQQTFARLPSWHAQPQWDRLIRIEIFTDGSAEWRGPSGIQVTPAAWAFSVWARTDEQLFFWGASAHQAVPPYTPFWLGEIEDTPLVAEVLALAWALVWSIEVGSRCKVPILFAYDSTSAGGCLLLCPFTELQAH